MAEPASAGAATGLGPLGRRLLAAFVAVSLVGLLTLLALSAWGVGSGIDDLAAEEHSRTADAAAVLVGQAYSASNGWGGVDLEEARALAHGASGRLTIFDAEGNRIAGPPVGRLTGSGPTSTQDLPTASAEVTQDGVSVGRVVVTYVDHLPLLITGRSLVWSWLAIAGLAGLLAATAVGWWVSRRFVRPIRGITRSAASFAAGDRDARADMPGLPGELGELARALDSAADAVVGQEAAGRRMVADLSHEIRGPLTTLQVGLEELRDGLVPVTPERLAALHDQSLRLGHVVEDLTQLASAQETPPSLVPEPCDLAVIAASALAAKDALLRVSGHMACPDLQSAAVTADPARVHQVVGNLLDNVIRYCPAGTHVTVSTGSRGAHAVLVIEDDGPGIPDADLAHVHTRLYRGANAVGVAGSGIGLAVAAEIIRDHHGTLAIDSPPDGRGTRVTVTLPARTTVTTDAPSHVPQGPRISNEPRPCPESGARRESGDRPSDQPAVR